MYTGQRLNVLSNLYHYSDGHSAGRFYDPLLAKVRASLRREHAFPRQGKFGVAAVYSTEPLRYPAMDGKSCDTSGAAPQGLNCAGIGSAVCVTSVFGMVAASWAINRIALD